jgi:predicted DNA-binding transcriptional regulator AlpA
MGRILKSFKSYRPKHGAELLGIGIATFWRWAKERPDFPKARKLSPRCTIFDGEELLAWRDEQKKAVSK